MRLFLSLIILSIPFFPISVWSEPDSVDAGFSLTRNAPQDSFQLNWTTSLSHSRLVLLEKVLTDDDQLDSTSAGWRVVPSSSNMVTRNDVSAGRYFYQLAEVLPLVTPEGAILIYGDRSQIVGVEVLNQVVLESSVPGSHNGNFQLIWGDESGYESTDLSLEYHSVQGWTEVADSSYDADLGMYEYSADSVENGNHQYRLVVNAPRYAGCSSSNMTAIQWLLDAGDCNIGQVTAEASVAVMKNSPQFNVVLDGLSWQSVPGADHYLLEKQSIDGSWIVLSSDGSLSSAAALVDNGVYRISACVNGSAGTVCSPSQSYYTHNLDLSYEPIDPAGESITDPIYYGSLEGVGEAKVNGSFSYNLPIEVPVGINGMEPEISLSYNSNTGNGLVGWGWSLNGQSAIGRCKASLFRDGYVSGVNNGEDYKFCLDGGRLVEVAARSYRTELESYAIISAVGGTPEVPDTWKINLTDGTVLTYGNISTVAGGDSAVRLDGDGDPMQWFLRKREDVAGNYLTYHYESDSTTGEHRLSHIDYTKNDAATATAINQRVLFAYEARTDVNQVFSAGQPRLLNKRLQAIETRVNTGSALSSGERVSKYGLVYQQKSSDDPNYQDPVNASRVKTITRCFATDGECALPLTLEWTDVTDTNTGEPLNTSASIKYGDFNGDGFMDAMTMLSEVPLSSYNSSLGRPTASDCVIDIDSDSDADIDFAIQHCGVTGQRGFSVVVAFGEKTNTLGDDITLAEYTRRLSGRLFDPSEREEVHRITDTYVGGTWFEPEEDWSIHAPYLTYMISHGFEIRDLNGDSMPDLLIRRQVEHLNGIAPAISGGQRTDVYLAQPQHLYEQGEVERFEYTPGYSFDHFILVDESGSTDISGWDDIDVEAYRTYTSYLVDLNADQLPDLLLQENWSGEPTLEVRINDGTGFGAKQLWFEDSLPDEPWPSVTVGLPAIERSPLEFADFNGDGLTDAAASTIFLLNTGSGFMRSAANWATDFLASGEKFNASSEDMPWKIDWDNADNAIYERKVGWYGTSGVPHYMPVRKFGPGPYSQHHTAQNYGRSLGDFNGDGLTDVLYETRQGLVVFLSTGDGFAPPQLWSNENDYATFTELHYVYLTSKTFDRSFIRDVNGDGLADVFSPSSKKVMFSTGSGFTAPLSVFGDSDKFLAQYYLGFVTTSVRGEYHFPHSSTRQTKADFVGEPWRASRPYFIDIDGNGLLDYVESVDFDALTIDPSTDNSVSMKPSPSIEGRAELLARIAAANPSQNKPFTQGFARVGVNRLGRHLLKVVRSGAGRTIAVQYSPLVQREFYSPGEQCHDAETLHSCDSLMPENRTLIGSTLTHGPDSNEYAPVGDGSQADTSIAGAIAVKSIAIDDGSGGVKNLSYTYGDARQHRNGFGRLGFTRRTETTTKPDEYGVSQTIHTMYDYHADVRVGESEAKYQLAGRLKRERTYFGSTSLAEACDSEPGECLQLLRESRYRWKVRKYSNGSHPAPHYFPYVYASSTSDYDLLTGAKIRGSRTGNYSTPSYIARELPDHHIGLGGNPEPLLETTVDEDYHPDGVLLTSWSMSADVGVVNGHAFSGVEIENVGSSIEAHGNRRGLVTEIYNRAFTGATALEARNNISTRKTEYSYYPQTGQLHTEAAGVLSGASAKITTAYTYNHYGSVNTLTESWLSTPNDGLAAITDDQRLSIFNETFNSNGERTLITTNSLGHDQTTVFDRRFGLPIIQIDLNDLGVTTTYDMVGRVFTQTDAVGNQTTVQYYACTECFAFSAHEQWFQYSKTRGETSKRIYYDGLGRGVGSEIKNLSGASVYTSQSYDVYGRMVAASEPFFYSDQQYVTQYTYDIQDRSRIITHPDLTTTEVTYSAHTETQTNREGQTQVKEYNHAGWLLRSTDNAGTPVEFSYYPFGDLKSTQVNNNAETLVYLEYDNLGRKTLLDDPNTGLVTYTYNPLGLLATETDGKNQATHYQYDSLGRQIGRVDDANSVVQPVGELAQRTHTWRYDLTSNGQSIDNARAAKTLGKLTLLSGFDTGGSPYSESTSYDADNFGLPSETTVVQDGRTFVTETLYDAWARPLATIYPKNLGSEGYSTFNVYNEHGFLARVDDSSGRALWVANDQDARGNVTEYTLGNGVITTKGYDPATGRIASINAAINGYTVQNHSYHFSALGNLEWRQDHRLGITQSFCYDDMNRLTDSRFATSCTSSTGDYQYDELGNVVSRAGKGAYSYGEVQAHGSKAGPNAVTSVGGASYAYDEAGNLISVTVGGSTEKKIVWSAFNKPISMSESGHSTSMVYGPHKRRIKRVDSNGRTTHYLLGVYEETSFQGDIEKVHYIGDYALYIETVDETTGTLKNVEWLFQHRDHIGSLVARTKDSPTLWNTEFLANDTWGERRSRSWDGELEDSSFVPSKTARGFTDHEHLDGVSLIHMNGRVYDPEIGRFLSPDVLVQSPHNTQSFNRYSYAWNNPLSLTDPSGYAVYGDCGLGCTFYAFTNGGLAALGPLGDFKISGRAGTFYNDGKSISSVAPGGGGQVSNSSVLAGTSASSSGGVSRSTSNASHSGSTNSSYDSLVLEEVVVHADPWSGYYSSIGPAPTNFNSYVSSWSGGLAWTTNITANYSVGRAAPVRFFNSHVDGYQNTGVSFDGGDGEALLQAYGSFRNNPIFRRIVNDPGVREGARDGAIAGAIRVAGALAVTGWNKLPPEARREIRNQAAGAFFKIADMFSEGGSPGPVEKPYVPPVKAPTTTTQIK